MFSLLRVFIILSCSFVLIDVLGRVNYDVELLNAAENGEHDRIDFIVNSGAYLDVRNNYGVTPLIWAANNGHILTLKALLNRNPDIEAAANNGKTSLLWASTWGHLDIIEVLLEKGANIEAQDKMGLTSLMCAAANNHLEVVKLLLKYNASTLVINNQGGTASSISKVKGHMDIYDLIIGVQNKQIISKYILSVNKFIDYMLYAAPFDMYFMFSDYCMWLFLYLYNVWIDAIRTADSYVSHAIELIDLYIYGMKCVNGLCSSANISEDFVKDL